MEAVYFDIRTSHAPGEFCKRVISADYFISFFETPFLYERDGELVPGEPRTVLILPPGTPVYHGPHPSAEEGFVNDWIYLRGGELTEMLCRYPLPMGTPFFVERRDVFRRYLENVKREYSAQVPGWQDQLLFLTGQLVIELYRMNRKNQAALDGCDRIEQVRGEIMRAPEKPWTLAEMAALSGYSASRFSALYRARFGCAPKQDVLTARIELAKRMLKYTNTSVTEVAYACGFQTIYYFSKYFKAVNGISPKEYAQKSSAAGDAY